jgi:hypothetical protein
MKYRLALFLAVLMGLAAIAGLAVQEDQRVKQDGHRQVLDAYTDAIKDLTNYPPGVSSKNWIALTANAGIVLKLTTSPGPQGKPAFVEYSGTFMFRPTSDSSWRVVILENPIK